MHNFELLKYKLYKIRSSRHLSRRICQILTCWIPFTKFRRLLRTKLLTMCHYGTNNSKLITKQSNRLKKIYKKRTLLELQKIPYYSKSNITLTSFETVSSRLETKPTLALHTTTMDKGGLEEVVLQLAFDKSIQDKFNVVIIESKGKNGYLAGIANENNIPVFSFDHDLDYLAFLINFLNIQIVHIHYDLVGFHTYRVFGVKTLYTIHNNYIWMNQEDIEYRKEFYKLMDAHVAVSSQVRNYFCKRFNFEKTRVPFINNGLTLFDIDAIESMEKKTYTLAEDDFVLINIATFSTVKSQFLQIAAMREIVSKYPNVKLLLVGNTADKDYAERIETMIKDSHLGKNIKIISYVPKEKIYSLLKMADSLIMTSITEGFSIVSLEGTYASKPLILSDVGGARDLIENNDIGIIVPNYIKKLENFSFDDYAKNMWNEELYADTVTPIINAIEEIYLNKEEWKEKATKGREKIEKIFNTSYVAQSYLKYYEELLQLKNINLENLKEKLKSLQIEVAFLGLYPDRCKVVEGWMSRMLAVDELIKDRIRVYINPFAGVDFEFVRQNDKAYEIRCNHESEDFQIIIDKVTDSVKFTYVHTLHLAEYIINFIKDRPIIVDIHGVTPEEEVMMGNAHLEEKYSLIEQEVLLYAKKCVMVTSAMHKHYTKKYPNIEVNPLILPIVERLDVLPYKEKVKTANPKRVIYAGSTAVWQNINVMLQMAKTLDKTMKFYFLSHEYKKIQKQANALGIKNAFFAQASKEELKDYYSESSYGLLIRDESPVNFVACPTKAYEYMACSIIPVLRSADLGDLKDFGYVYLLEEDFLAGKVFDKTQMKKAIEANHQVVKKMQKLYKTSADILREYLINV